ncbi:MAG TPA: FxLYD domain-containing protein [Candidatus Paceibacterota bacterium]|nr:FxLYD domain-containing protein [Candidatus Paceibacterota bacterium]
MSSWGKKRRNFILFLFTFFILVLLGVYLFIIYSVEPTCFDNKRNGDETGVDCGGSCKLICDGQAIEPIIHWSRYFEIIPGFYNAVAYIENLNSDSGVNSAQYKITLYDSKNFPLETRVGTIRIRPREIIPIFEPALNTGQLIPVRSTFEFTNNLVWEKMQPRDRYLQITKQRFFEVDGLPRISAEITNTSINRANNISIIVVVYDSDSNTITTSSTLVETLNKDETKQFVYTWPQKFPREMSRFEIIPLYE